MLSLAECMSCLSPAVFLVRASTDLAAPQSLRLKTEMRQHDLVIRFRKPGGTARFQDSKTQLAIAPDNLLHPGGRLALHFALDLPEEYTNAFL